jgi:hypothetical protein
MKLSHAQRKYRIKRSKQKNKRVLKKQEPGIWIAKEKKKKKGKRAGLQKSIIRMLVAQQVVPTKQTKSVW